MIRLTLILSVMILAGWISYFTLVNVNTKNVAITQNMDWPVVSEPLKAGDLVEVSADNQRVMSFVCSMNLPKEDVDAVPHAKRYTNGLAQSLSGFTALVNWGKSLAFDDDSEPLAEIKPMNVVFVGSISSIPNELHPHLRDSCVCEVAGPYSVATRFMSCANR